MAITFMERALRVVGLQRTPQPAAPARKFSAMNSPYRAASMDRLTADWAVALLSPDQEVRVALRSLRGRSRQLAMNNPHAKRFLNAAKEQVIGQSGVALELAFDTPFPGADLFSRQIEKAWRRWGMCCTADQKMSLTEQAQLWLISVLADGESFVQKLSGYPHNESSFALQMIDPDQVDINRQRLRRPGDTSAPNEIRMGVEVDQYRRAVAYHLYEGHPAEFAGVVALRVPASQLDHSFLFQRVNQTRGVPWMHAAMMQMNMLGEYDIAEITASRWAACKMAFLISKTGDEYDGGTDQDPSNPGGPISVTVEPGTVEELPAGVEPKVIDWQHPSHNYESFSLSCLRNIAVGVNCSYTTLTGDLRSVNFSSIRQGVLTERDGWAVIQDFVINKFYRPTFAAWLPMAVLTGQVVLPRGMSCSDICEAVIWTPRGWDWVDPNKDVQASITAIRAGLSTYQKEASKRGLDWRKVFQQRATENAEAKKLGLALDLTTSGAGGIEGATGAEDPERAAQPTDPAPLAPAKKGADGAKRLPA